MIYKLWQSECGFSWCNILTSFLWRVESSLCMCLPGPTADVMIPWAICALMYACSIQPSQISLGYDIRHMLSYQWFSCYNVLPMTTCCSYDCSCLKKVVETSTHICISELGSSLVQLMACHLFGAKQLPEPMLNYYTPRTTKLLGGILVSLRPSVRPSVRPACRVRSVTSTVLDGYFPY